VDEQHLGPVHTLYFRILGEDAAGGGVPAGGDAPPAELDLEVDVAAHPYQALRIAERREWTLALPADALHVTAGAPRPGIPAVDELSVELPVA
jgi:hypothetical protein